MCDDQTIIDRIKDIQCARKSLLFIAEGLNEIVKDTMCFSDLLMDIDEQLLKDFEVLKKINRIN